METQKRLIFVGGCIRSGTTLLNLILASQPNSMSLGEVQYIFNPIKKKHNVKIRELIENNSIWKIIIEDGAENLYTNLIKFFPKKSIFIDSSKNPIWYRNQVRWNEDLSFMNILVYKHPLDLKVSLEKRGKNSWESVFVNYHTKYFALTEMFKSIYLDDLLNNEQVYKNLFYYLGIQVRNSKINYNLEGHPNFFGSDTVLQNKIKKENLIIRDAFAEMEDKLMKKSKKPSAVIEVLSRIEKFDVSIDRVIENVFFVKSRFHFRKIELLERLKLFIYKWTLRSQGNW